MVITSLLLCFSDIDKLSVLDLYNRMGYLFLHITLKYSFYSPISITFALKGVTRTDVIIYIKCH